MLMFFVKGHNGSGVGEFVGTPVSEELSFLRKKVKLYIYGERRGGAQNCLAVCLSLQASTIGTESHNQRGFRGFDGVHSFLSPVV